jgi:hypothetical protein
VKTSSSFLYKTVESTEKQQKKYIVESTNSRNISRCRIYNNRKQQESWQKLMCRIYKSTAGNSKSTAGKFIYILHKNSREIK